MKKKESPHLQWALKQKNKVQSFVISEAGIICMNIGLFYDKEKK